MRLAVSVRGPPSPRAQLRVHGDGTAVALLPGSYLLTHKRTVL